MHISERILIGREFYKTAPLTQISYSFNLNPMASVFKRWCCRLQCFFHRWNLRDANFVLSSAVRHDRMRGGRNKFGPMYKRDRARKLQVHPMLQVQLWVTLGTRAKTVARFGLLSPSLLPFYFYFLELLPPSPNWPSLETFLHAPQHFCFVFTPRRQHIRISCFCSTFNYHSFVLNS